MLVGGEPVTKYKELDEQYDVWLRAELPFRDRAEVIEQLMIHSPKAGLVQLNSLATLTPAKGPATIERFGMQRQVVVIANLEGNKALGDAVDELGSVVDALSLPADYHYDFLGKAKVMGESNQNFLIAFLTSFLFMYMILAAQFESFVHPITILLALPLTLPFALISLILLRTNLNLYAMFGLFMLFGIVKKNGILQVDFTNVLRRPRLPRDEAILEANHTRLRPILMTTVMLIAAMVPIALGQGPGAASRASLAKVILGGQTLSLLLTLLVTPVAYSLWEDVIRWGRWLFPRFGRGGPGEPAGPEPRTAASPGPEEDAVPAVAGRSAAAESPVVPRSGTRECPACDSGAGSHCRIPGNADRRGTGPGIRLNQRPALGVGLPTPPNLHARRGSPDPAESPRTGRARSRRADPAICAARVSPKSPALGGSPCSLPTFCLARSRCRGRRLSAVPRKRPAGETGPGIPQPGGATPPAPYHAEPSVRIDATGILTAGGKKPATLPRGQRLHMGMLADRASPRPGRTISP